MTVFAWPVNIPRSTAKVHLNSVLAWVFRDDGAEVVRAERGHHLPKRPRSADPS